MIMLSLPEPEQILGKYLVKDYKTQTGRLDLNKPVRQLVGMKS